MEKRLSKTDLIDKIRSSSYTKSKKPALFNKDKILVTYKDFIAAYDLVKEFIVNSPIRPYHRIAVIADNELLTAITALPILDYSVLIFLDSDLSQDNFEERLKLLKVDYIASIKMKSPACIAADKIGLGIIHIDSVSEFKLNRLSITRLPDKNLTDRNVGKGDFAFIRTTSGTTNIPKVVPATASTFMAASDRFIRGYDYSEKDITLITTKMSKTMSFNLMIRTLYCGGTAVLAGGLSHSDFIRLLIEFKVTNVTVTPAFLSSYAAYIKKNGVKPVSTSLRFARTSGAPLPRNLKEYMEKFFKVSFDQSYGMTETTNISGTYNAPKGYKEGSAGVSTGLDVKILNGEILVRGDTVFPGYDNEGIDNSIYFTEEWFHTGDLGRIDEDGYIFVTGRIKEMINRGGEKISPYEVETAIMRHPDIMDAVVFPYPNDYGSENAGAVVVMDQTEPIALSDLRSFLKNLIPAYKMPTILYTVHSIPVGKNGKVQRKQLYEHLKKSYPLQNKLPKSLNRRGLSSTEKKLLKIWESTLKTKMNDKNATFTDLGGDSLNGAVVLSEIEDKFNVRLPVDILFDDGTLSGSAEFIETEIKNTNKFKCLVPIKQSGSKKPLICAHSGIGDATTYRFIGKNMEDDRPVYALRFDNKNISWQQPLLFTHLADQYVKEIKWLDPEGPYYICGNCWGGVLAFKIASLLKEEGYDVGMLAMFDSAAKNRKKDLTETRTKLLPRIRKALNESIEQIKDRPFKGKVYLIIKKIFSIKSLILLTQAHKLYSLGVRKNSKLLMDMAGKAGALGHAYKKYKPVKYDGTIHFFKATSGTLGKSKNHAYWKTMSSKFELHTMKCHHNDLIIGENSKILTNTLVKLMEKSDV